MNALFFSQLKNMSWTQNDFVVDVDGETLTVATLIERYKVLKNALADIKSMTKPKPEPTTKSTNKTKAKTKSGK